MKLPSEDDPVSKGKDESYLGNLGMCEVCGEEDNCSPDCDCEGCFRKMINGN